MNEQRRQAVLEIIEKINRLYADVNDIKSLIANIESEQDKAVSNAPNNLQNTELFKAMQKALGYIEEAKNEIDNAMIKNIVFIEGRRDGYSVSLFQDGLQASDNFNF